MSDPQGARTPNASHEFEAHRAYLTRLAYRMLGSIAEAEDAVQDGYLRWHRQDTARVDNPRAFLNQVVTRLCLDRIKQTRNQREHYVGVWLPEPLVEDWSAAEHAASPVDQDVTVALMLALERLSPLERAAFILHDIFDMAFDDVATALGRTEAACRQLASRARRRVISAKPRFKIDPNEGRVLPTPSSLPPAAATPQACNNC
ncbi:sigma-70 family RNA polymerase sigma factor [Modicisalibacter luteus]|uniref:sigma-70 family RNA polymerase sigma factor n=1 Tax=Modicisalibacter luteus TaxID=453962 RepID=UPI0036423DBC